MQIYENVITIDEYKHLNIINLIFILTGSCTVVKCKSLAVFSFGTAPVALIVYDLDGIKTLTMLGYSAAQRTEERIRKLSPFLLNYKQFIYYK